MFERREQHLPDSLKWRAETASTRRRREEGDHESRVCSESTSSSSTQISSQGRTWARQKKGATHHTEGENASLLNLKIVRIIAHGGQPRINNLRQGPILVRDLVTHVACLSQKCRNAGSRNERHAPFHLSVRLTPYILPLLLQIIFAPFNL